MEATSTNVQRRSSRMITSVPVRAQGMNADGRKFHESSHTIVVNAHGGLLLMRENVELGTEIVLVNPATEEEQECRVVYVGDSSDKGTRVGIEFLSPSPHFWGIEFGQQEWPTNSPSSPLH